MVDGFHHVLEDLVQESGGILGTALCKERHGGEDVREEHVTCFLSPVSASWATWMRLVRWMRCSGRERGRAKSFALEKAGIHKKGRSVLQV